MLQFHTVQLLNVKAQIQRGTSGNLIVLSTITPFDSKKRVYLVREKYLFQCCSGRRAVCFDLSEKYCRKSSNRSLF